MTERRAVPCDICGSTEVEILAGTDVFDSGMRTVICRGCALVYTSPRLPSVAYREFYEKDYRDLYFTTEAAAAAGDALRLRRERPLGDWRVDHYQNYLVGDVRLADIGAGLGGFLTSVRDRVPGSRVVAVEPDVRCAGILEQRFGLSVSTVSLEDWEGPDMPLTHVSLFHVLEHAESPTRMLESLRGLLPSNGLLFVEVPNLEGPWSDIAMLHPAHLYHFTKQTLTRALERAGFAVERVDAWNDDPLPISLSAVARVASGSKLRLPPREDVDAEVRLVQRLFEARLANAEEVIRRKARRDAIARVLGARLTYRLRVAMGLLPWRNRAGRF